MARPAAKTVLFVDDEEDSRKLYKTCLSRAGFTVLLAESGPAALEAAVSAEPDVIISDVDMPGGDGLTLCAALRGDPRTADIPILLMSGHLMDEESQLEGLGRGADDYLLKPCSGRYLAAKIAAVWRRYAAPGKLKRVLTTHGLVLDAAARTVTLRGRRIALTRKEFDLLTAFLEKPGRVLSPRFLLERVWGYDPADYDDPHTVIVHLSSLRRKLGPALGRRIATVSGAGYRFDPA